MINVRAVRLVSQASSGGVPGRNLRVRPAPECGHARYEKMWDVPEESPVKFFKKQKDN